MAAVTGSLFDLHSQRIEEVINKSVDVILPGIDPIWQGMITTSQGVGPVDAIGRDMKIIRVFQGGMTGILEQAAPRNDFVLYGDDTDTFGTRLHIQNLNQTFPDPTKGPNQSPYRLAVRMRAMVANIMFTLGELTAEANRAFIGQILAPKLEGFARNISHTLCNYFYLDESTEYKICDAGQITQSGSGPYYLSFEPQNFACDRFYPGMRVDIYDGTNTDRLNDSQSAAASQTLSTRDELFVDRVDEMTNTVVLVSDTDPESAWSGHGGENPDVATDNQIHYANSRLGAGVGTGFAGLNSWLKTSGNLLGNDADGTDDIDVDSYPEHKSMTKALGGAPLTEHYMRQVLRRFHASKNKYGQYVDCVVASDGVWLAYEQQKIGRETIERAGRMSSIKSEGSGSDANYGNWGFTMDGRNYMGYTSTYVEDGVVYFFRKGGSNWKRYVPPDPGSTRNFEKVPAFIPFKFVVPAITGLGSAQLPIYDSSGSGNLSMVTEGSQMPGWVRLQLVPEQFSGIKLTGVGTDRIYADT